MPEEKGWREVSECDYKRTTQGILVALVLFSSLVHKPTQMIRFYRTHIHINTHTHTHTPNEDK